MNFTILMDNNKFLQITSRATLYQGENYVDTFQIIVPKTYNDIDLRPFTVCLEYVDEYQNAYLDILVPLSTSGIKFPYKNKSSLSFNFVFAFLAIAKCTDQLGI